MPTRDEIRQLVKDGFRPSEIAENLGLHPVTVYRHLSEYNEKRRVQLAEKRRAEGARRYRCGVCDQFGHNARRHR